MEDLDWSALSYSYTMDGATQQTWVPEQVDMTQHQQAQNRPMHPRFSSNHPTHLSRRRSSTVATQHGRTHHHQRHPEGENTTTVRTPDLNLGDSQSWNSVMSTTMGPPQGYPLEPFYFPDQEASACRDQARRPGPLRHSRSQIVTDRRHLQHPRPQPSPQERDQERYTLMQLEQIRAVEEAHRRNSLPEMGLGMGMARQEDEYLQQIAAFHHQQQAQAQQQGQYFEAATHTQQHQRTHHRQHLIHNNNNLPLSHTRQQAHTEGSPLHPHFPQHQQPPPHRHMGEDPRSPLGAQALYPSPPLPPTDSRTSSTDMGMGMGVVKYEEEYVLEGMDMGIMPVGLME